MKSLKEGGDGCHFYCSKECKQLCPIYMAHIFPKDYVPYQYDDGIKYDLKVRKAVLDRDNYECQRCEKQDNLEVHHIEPRVIKPELINDPENLLTFCEECHRWIHTNISGCEYHKLRKNNREIKELSEINGKF